MYMQGYYACGMRTYGYEAKEEHSVNTVPGGYRGLEGLSLLYCPVDFDHTKAKIPTTEKMLGKARHEEDSKKHDWQAHPVFCEPGSFISVLDFKMETKNEVNYSGITGIRFKCSHILHQNQVIRDIVEAKDGLTPEQESVRRSMLPEVTKVDQQIA